MRRWIVAGALLFVAFLAASLPAGVLAPALAPHATLVNPRGTVWRGGAEALALKILPVELRLPDFRWDMRLARLWRGELAVDARFGAAAEPSRAILVAGFSGRAAEDVRVTLPAGPVLQALPLADLWRPGGELRLQAKRLAFADGSISGDAELDWLDASVRLSPVTPLGSYRLLATGAGGGARFRVETARGPLLVAGAGDWSPKAGGRFAGSARAEAGFQDRLALLLTLMGKRDPAGAYAIDLALPPAGRKS